MAVNVAFINSLIAPCNSAKPTQSYPSRQRIFLAERNDASRAAALTVQDSVEAAG